MFSVYFRRVGYSELKSLLISLGFSRYRRVEKWEKTAQSTWNGDLIYGENATYRIELVSEEVLLVAQELGQRVEILLQQTVERLLGEIASDK